MAEDQQGTPRDENLRFRPLGELQTLAGMENWSLEKSKSELRQQGFRLGEPPSSPGSWMWLLTRAGVSRRKQRLFACACCRALWSQLTDPRSREAIEVAERYADGQTTLDVLQQTRVTAFYAFRAGKTDAARTALCAVEEYVALERVSRHASRCGVQEEQRDWLRDLLGESVVRPKVEQSWRLHDRRRLLAIAQTVYDERRFSELPILADALEDAGCTDAELLAHCRGPAPHTRGCYVLDAILGLK